MIIAPLSTPIMGVGLGIVRRSTSITRRSAVYTVLGALAVVAIGSVFSLAVPGGVDLLHDSQIASRTSPGLVDLVSAVATGLAGAVAFARRDVAAVLPGVAIAISLVPPLAVVGVCLGQGAVALALGALVLFVSNFVALVLSGSLLFTSAGYVAEAPGTTQLSRRRANLAIACCWSWSSCRWRRTPSVPTWSTGGPSACSRRPPRGSARSPAPGSRRSPCMRSPSTSRFRHPERYRPRLSSCPTCRGRSRTASPSSSPRPSGRRPTQEWSAIHRRAMRGDCRDDVSGWS